MIDQNIALEIIARGDERRAARRHFLKAAGGGAAVVGGLSLLAACGPGDESGPLPQPSPTPTPATAINDATVLNFALNLEYLEATFYAFAATGSGLSAALSTGGDGSAAGAVTGGRQVTFTDRAVRGYANEIAQDEINHVRFLRTALGSAAVARPALNIDGGANGAFTAAARAAGLITAAQTFDPYESENNFLLAAFLFEDVGVTAYKGGSVLLSSKTFLEAAAGILAAEAYHAGLVRTVLYGRGLRSQADAISNARDSLDGTTDLDQGISSTDGGLSSNLVPTDANGIVYSRTTGQVLNVVYLNRASVMQGGFFPSGLNGTVQTSAPN